jgi:photosystem II stability/assembly factor-like uncharacterized protein
MNSMKNLCFLVVLFAISMLPAYQSKLIKWNSIISSDDSLNSLLATSSNEKSIFFSNDGGNSWLASSSIPRLPWNGITSSSSGQFLSAIAMGNSIYYSEDHGNIWEKSINSPSLNWNSITSSKDGKYVYATALSESIFLSSNYGKNWKKVVPSSSSLLLWKKIITSQNGKEVFAIEMSGSVSHSSDYGENWEILISSSVGLPSHTTWYDLTMGDANGQCLALLSLSDGIYLSRNHGNSFEQATSLNHLSSNTGVWQSITSDSKCQSLTVVSSDGTIYSSSDFGLTWNDNHSSAVVTSSTTSHKLLTVLTDQLDGKKLLAFPSETLNTVYSSIDAGNSWKSSFSILKEIETSTVHHSLLSSLLKKKEASSNSQSSIEKEISDLFHVNEKVDLFSGFSPSFDPSSFPSGIPSFIPSSIPSSLPTLTPSSFPSSLPSTSPSTIPSSQPPSKPYAHPTSQPSHTSKPTVVVVPEAGDVQIDVSTKYDGATTSSAPPGTTSAAKTAVATGFNVKENYVTLTSTSTTQMPTLGRRTLRAGEASGAGGYTMDISITAITRYTYVFNFFVLFKLADNPSFNNNATALIASAQKNFTQAFNQGILTTIFIQTLKELNISGFENVTASQFQFSAIVLTTPPLSTSDNDHELTDGEIAGIVIGSFFGFLCIVVGIIMAYRLKKDRDSNEIVVMDNQVALDSPTMRGQPFFARSFKPSFGFSRGNGNDRNSAIPNRQQQYQIDMNTNDGFMLQAPSHNTTVLGGNGGIVQRGKGEDRLISGFADDAMIIYVDNENDNNHETLDLSDPNAGVPYPEPSRRTSYHDQQIIANRTNIEIRL